MAEPPSAADLCTLGRQVLESVPEDIDRALTLLERYAESMDRWVEEYTAGQIQESPETLEELAEVHGSLVTWVGQTASEEREKLRGLRQRGQGLRAYLDVFPRRIQSRRTRKT